ncbi:glycosyltransferase involved in cell wall biosynthesis [Varunaivibrio sulfuroxidans]|uniref:Glycosyltransferase involved in cell wall biosynthesis n=1 Tax=Varunaivibrio sulfuroxidans TaxID=1773489 RepID=A0A4R3J976_9PROT|nr:glycosyltransferase involved in cell wall biosynthesis [Varunaivibrio sulfuroxidans]
MKEHGHEAVVIGPDRFSSIPCPTYPEIRLAIAPGGKLTKLIEDAMPAAIHIATEGPLGVAARRYCLKRGHPFTTAYHTRFPQYIHSRFRIPCAWSYRFLRWFHNPSSAIMVATQSIEDDLRARGFTRIRRWSRGVDTKMFHPRDKQFLSGPRPISLYVGRIAVEKNIDDFLSLDLPGTKYVVGDGPQMAHLQKRHPEVRFVGMKSGEDLARHYAAADVFVFPSRTDTFGLVLLEALASGVPVAAYPVAGPLDVIGGTDAGVLDEDLRTAVLKALGIPAETCRALAGRYSWAACTEQFIANLHPFENASVPIRREAEAPSMEKP